MSASGVRTNSLLTERQLEILKLRRKGLSLSEIAERIGTTRQNVSIIEKRSMQRIEAAAATLSQLEDQKIVVVVNISKGTHILDAMKSIIQAADVSGVKLKGNVVDLLSWLRTSMEGRISSGKLTRDCRIIILDTGKCLFTS